MERNLSRQFFSKRFEEIARFSSNGSNFVEKERPQVDIHQACEVHHSQLKILSDSSPTWGSSQCSPTRLMASGARPCGGM